MQALKIWARRVICFVHGHDIRIISRKLRVAHCRRCKSNDVWTARLAREGHKHADR